MTERISADDLQKILSTGESASVEFHATVPTLDVFAREIAAFANAQGGHILFGIYFDGTIVGASQNDIETALYNCQSRIRPSVQAEVYSIESNEKTVVAVRVLPSTLRPVFANGSAVIRTGAQVVALSPEQILRAIPGRENLQESVNQELENFAHSISDQTKTIDSLRQQLAEGQKWQGKLKDWILGGIIGATIGVILSALAGML
jgi:predicted HTH transcriptional regulator